MKKQNLAVIVMDDGSAYDGIAKKLEKHFQKKIQDNIKNAIESAAYSFADALFEREKNSFTDFSQTFADALNDAIKESDRFELDLTSAINKENSAQKVLAAIQNNCQQIITDIKDVQMSGSPLAISRLYDYLNLLAYNMHKLTKGLE